MALCKTCGCLVVDWRLGRPNKSCPKGTDCYRKRNAQYQREHRERRDRRVSFSLTSPAPPESSYSSDSAHQANEGCSDNRARGARIALTNPPAAEVNSSDGAGASRFGLTPPLLIDLFCGLGGASQPFVDAGWEVVRVDVRPDVAATVVSDIRAFEWSGRRPDVLWASPPCDEFAKLRLKQWHKSQGFPIGTLQLVAEVARIVAHVRPRLFLLENVAGAIPYLGQPTRRIGPFCLWGDFPFFLASMDTPKSHRKYGVGARRYGKLARAVVPYQVGNNLRLAVEADLAAPRFV